MFSNFTKSIIEKIANSQNRDDKNPSGTFFIQNWIDKNINRLTAFGILISVGTFIQSMSQQTIIMIILGYCFILLSVVIWLIMDKETIYTLALITDEKEQIVYLFFNLIVYISNIIIILYAVSTIKKEHIGIMMFVYSVIWCRFTMKLVDRLNNKSKSKIINLLYTLFIVFIIVFSLVDFSTMFSYSFKILRVLQQ
ncbi:hypothetical protein K7J14_14785 [Treponema zuelzerae]|uniref:Uncharacterized protein n=1 Tax=Teretinema zuelzerae TaxID=156 RepID=A0AAE3JJW5_9SPIR|nr:hypothetical protein [Teretinema zuelzerae]MCD1655963.1 hypothetical protein [Teretinema zuelzerae]